MELEEAKSVFVDQYMGLSWGRSVRPSYQLFEMLMQQAPPQREKTYMPWESIISE